MVFMRKIWQVRGKRCVMLCQVVCGLALLFTASVFAHFPLMDCWYQGDVLVCEAGYSDGSSAADYDIKVFDYSDNLIAIARTDAQSRAQFTRPSGEFYIVFDAGHEMPVERDGSEIVAK